MANSHDRILTVAIRVARSAGEMISRAFHVSSKEFDSKENFRDLVTQTDKDVESHIIEELKKEFPTHLFIGEESATAGVKQKLSQLYRRQVLNVLAREHGRHEISTLVEDVTIVHLM